MAPLEQHLRCMACSRSWHIALVAQPGPQQEVYYAALEIIAIGMLT